MKKTLVIGASENQERYSNMAVKLLVKYQHNVIAIGNKTGNINGVEIIVGMPDLKEIDTVTLYINPKFQEAYYNFIISLKPKRIIFNPGTENIKLMELAEQKGIAAIVACTLVMLKTGQY